MSDAQTANAILAPTASSVLTHIVKSIVDTPDAVKIESIEDEGKIILEVRVAFESRKARAQLSLMSIGW